MSTGAVQGQERCDHALNNSQQRNGSREKKCSPPKTKMHFRLQQVYGGVDHTDQLLQPYEIARKSLIGIKS